MGSWGPGIFENDAALNLHDALLRDFRQQIEQVLPALDIAAIDELMVLVHMVAVARESGAGAQWIGLKRAEKWQQRFLEVYDARIDATGPVPGFKEARRQAIADTFERLIAACSPRLGPEAPS